MEDPAVVQGDADVLTAEAAGGKRLSDHEAAQFVVATIQQHAAPLLRSARRHSVCADDAQDAYQRAMEIFLRRAPTLDPDRAVGWLHVVVKHEAMAVREARLRLLNPAEADMDGHEARDVASPEDRLLGFEQITRSAEALQRLKPHEARALWLKAAGCSYADIAQQTGWTRTKVNRCLTEGRRSFLARYASIESGAECDRWAPVVSAMVDGEATREQVAQARPHLRNCPACRAMARDVTTSAEALRALFPVALVAGARPASGGDGGWLVRTYDALTAGLHERAASSALKVQAALDAASAGKVAAVAASAAALAGGGIAVVDRASTPAHHPAQHRGQRAPAAAAREAKIPTQGRRTTAAAPSRARPRTSAAEREFGGTDSGAQVVAEFGGAGAPAGQASAASAAPAAGSGLRRSPSPPPAASGDPGAEFGP